MDILGQLWMCAMIISVVMFCIGLILVCIESQKKLGAKILIASAITFAIGFGTCVAVINLGSI